MAALSWDQEPEYLAATDWTLAPGVPAEYEPPRPKGEGPDDITSFHPGQRLWSLNNLPNIFYVLEPSEAWRAFANSSKPNQKRDIHGRLMFEPHAGNGDARPLLDFKILPDHISTNESWQIMECWRRLDPRIRWCDITMRMCNVTERPADNTLQFRLCRGRVSYSLIAWQPKGVNLTDNRRRDEVLEKLTKEQIENNTTRGSTPGLIDPMMGAAGGTIPYPVQGRGARKPSARAQSKTAGRSVSKVTKSETNQQNNSERRLNRNILKNETEQIPLHQNPEVIYERNKRKRSMSLDITFEEELSQRARKRQKIVTFKLPSARLARISAIRNGKNPPARDGHKRKDTINVSDTEDNQDADERKHRIIISDTEGNKYGGKRKRSVIVADTEDDQDGHHKRRMLATGAAERELLPIGWSQRQSWINLSTVNMEWLMDDMPKECMPSYKAPTATSPTVDTTPSSIPPPAYNPFSHEATTASQPPIATFSNSHHTPSPASELPPNAPLPRVPGTPGDHMAATVQAISRLHKYRRHVTTSYAQVYLEAVRSGNEHDGFTAPELEAIWADPAVGAAVGASRRKGEKAMLEKETWLPKGMKDPRGSFEGPGSMDSLLCMYEPLTWEDL